jgi:mRNA interferase RelE/StbE
LVAKDLRGIPKRGLTRILRRIERLADDPRPRGCEKLSGQGRYRIRQGQYRIPYEMRDDVLIVTVVKVGHRRDVDR